MTLLQHFHNNQWLFICKKTELKLQKERGNGKDLKNSMLILIIDN